MAKSIDAILCSSFDRLEAAGRVTTFRKAVGSHILARRYCLTNGFVVWLGDLVFAKPRTARSWLKKELVAARGQREPERRNEVRVVEALLAADSRKHLPIVLVLARNGHNVKQAAKETGHTPKTVRAAWAKLKA